MYSKWRTRIKWSPPFPFVRQTKNIKKDKHYVWFLFQNIKLIKNKIVILGIFIGRVHLKILIYFGVFPRGRAWGGGGAPIPWIYLNPQHQRRHSQRGTHPSKNKAPHTETWPPTHTHTHAFPCFTCKTSENNGIGYIYFSRGRVSNLVAL